MGKSETCYGKKGPLTEYDSKEEAQEGADYAAEKYGKELEPYECSKCSKWHLSPKGRSTPNTFCKDCNKNAYSTEADARKRANIIKKEKQVELKIYPCPHGHGWHLTSRDE